MKVVNLYGGPGTGKSTTAAALFSLMKWRQHNVELIGEYAKEATWEHRYTILEDQLYVTAKQNRKLSRIHQQVDWAVTDSPLLLGLIYSKPDYLPNHYVSLVRELYATYDNVNIFLERKKPYQKVGRSQTEEEARTIDDCVRKLLDTLKEPYVVVSADENAHFKIYDMLIGK